MNLIDYLKTPSSEVFQIGISFVLGLLFGPLSYGMSYNILFIFFYEIGLFYLTKNFPGVYKLETRIICNISALVGWVLGRCLLVNETGFEGVEKYFN